jgi:hypothetical protein
MKAESHYNAHQRLQHVLVAHRRIGTDKRPPTNAPRAKEQQLATFNAAFLKRERRNARRLALAKR